MEVLFIAHMVITKLPQWDYTKPPVGTTIDWSHPLSRGLVGCWLFNEGAGKLANDLCNKNNAVITNGAWNGYGMVLNGTSAYANCGTSSVFIPRYFSIVIKIRNIGAIDQYDIAWSRVVDSGNGIRLYTRDTSNHKLCFDSISSGFTDRLTSNSSWLAANHVVCTVDGTNNYIYVNGVYDNSLASTNVPYDSGGPLYFGCMYTIPGRFFPGTYEHVYFYKRAISSLEVSQLTATPYCFLAPPGS
jgi:hypothetical protein